MGSTLSVRRDPEGQGWLTEETAPTPSPAAEQSGPGIIVDLFAGGGGASTGIFQATGRHPDIAINHDRHAVAVHAINHPTTSHLLNKITTIDPMEATGGRKVWILWASPDCKHFSKAKGGKPVQKNIRDLAWVVVLWAQRTKPELIFVENVEEFTTWGPLKDGRPDPERKGEEFKAWTAALRRAGYVVEYRELVAADYGTPTTRKRLFIVARRTGTGAIAWPEPTHSKGGKGGLTPWRAAAEIIDWSLPTQSIFDRKRPLVPATCARLATGIFRFVLNHANPFIVPLTHQGDSRVYDMAEPTRTVTGAQRGEWALVRPVSVMTNTTGHPGRSEEDHLATVTTGDRHYVTAPLAAPTTNGCGGRAGQSRPRSAEEPTATVTSKADACLTLTHIAPFGVPRYGEREGQEPRTHSTAAPLPVIVPTQNGFTLAGAELAAWLAQHNTGVTGHEMEEPVSTICQTGAHQQLVTSYLLIQRKQSVGREMDEPAPTATAHTTHFQAVEVSHLEVMRNHATGSSLEGPAPVVAAEGNHQFLVRTSTVPLGEPLEDLIAEGVRVDRVLAFLLTYYKTSKGQSADEPLRTVTTRDRHGVVTVYAATLIDGRLHLLLDIHMRMLSPRELYRAQGFPDDYVIDPILDGKRLSKTHQVRMCGNSVCPPLAAALVRANIAEYLEAAA